MKKEAFLRALDKRLEGMSAEERARALEFCAESIDDRVEDGMDEEAAVAALGDVETVARGLLADRPLGAVVRERVRRESSAGRVILLICASPLLVTFFALGLSVYAALWAAMVSVYAAVASLLIAGAGCALGGVALMFMQGAAPGLCVCGAGLVSFALGAFAHRADEGGGQGALEADKGLWARLQAADRGKEEGRMKKTVKVAVALLIAGVVLALAGFAMAGFDFGNLNTGGALVERQYEAEGDVVELVVADRNADIVITPSEDGKARLTCWENEEAAYDIREEGGRLYIEKIEQRQNGLGAWFGFHLNGKLEIELPAGAHVDISNGNGAVRVDGGDGVSFPTVTIATDNGPVDVRNVSSGAVALGTDNDQRDRGKYERGYAAR